MNDLDIIFNYSIQDEDVGMRLDKFLSLKMPDLSRSFFQKLIEKDLVLVNEKSSKSAYKLAKNDKIIVYDQEIENNDLKAEDIPLDIIYEDEDLIVLNKPKGMVVHPSISHYHGTLVNALLYHSKNLSSVNGEYRPGIVHRIDKDTSGLLVVAKNDKAHIFLQNQLQDKTMYRNYLALVYGHLESESGTIEAPIGRDLKNRQRMAVVKNGKEAITHFKTRVVYNDYTLLECRLETGRTHQIRVHLAYINHPIVGDALYGPKKVIGKEGQFLHAYQIHFVHPRTHKEMAFEVPLPKYFQDFLEKLGGF